MIPIVSDEAYVPSPADFYVIYDLSGISDILYGGSQETLEAFAGYITAVNLGIDEWGFYAGLETTYRSRIGNAAYEEMLDNLATLIVLFPEREILKHQQGFLSMYYRAAEVGMFPFSSIALLSADRFALRLTGVK